MDDASLRENARAAIGPEGLENLIRAGNEMIERAKELVKAADAAIHASELLAISRGTLRQKLRHLGFAIDKVCTGETSPSPAEE